MKGASTGCMYPPPSGCGWGILLLPRGLCGSTCRCASLNMNLPCVQIVPRQTDTLDDVPHHSTVSYSIVSAKQHPGREHSLSFCVQHTVSHPDFALTSCVSCQCRRGLLPSAGAIPPESKKARPSKTSDMTPTRASRLASPSPTWDTKVPYHPRSPFDLPLLADAVRREYLYHYQQW